MKTLDMSFLDYKQQPVVPDCPFCGERMRYEERVVGIALRDGLCLAHRKCALQKIEEHY